MITKSNPMYPVLPCKGFDFSREVNFQVTVVLRNRKNSQELSVFENLSISSVLVLKTTQIILRSVRKHYHQKM